MTQPRVRSVGMAIALAGIGAGALTTIGLRTELSATIQLFLVVVGIACFVVATFTFGHVRLAPGQALVISGRGGLRVVRGSVFLFSLQNTCLVPLTPKSLEVNFDKPPYPLTMDGLAVTVKVYARVAVDDKDEAVIMAAKILANKKEETDLYEEGGKTTLKGIIPMVLSENSYQDPEMRKRFAETVLERWDRSTALTLSAIRIVDLHQISAKEAKLSGTDSDRAESAEKKLQAKIAVDNAKSEITKCEAEADALGAKENLKRTQEALQHETNIIKLEQHEGHERIKKALQHETNIIKLEEEDAVAAKNTKFAENRVANERARRDLLESQAGTNRIVKITEANITLEVEKILNDVVKNRAKGELDLERQYLEVRDKELTMLDKNKGGDLRYQLAKEAISMSSEQAKALATALGNARIIGAIDDLPQLAKMLKTPIALREVLAEFLGVLDDELMQGIGRFFRGVAAARKEARSPDPTSSQVHAASGMTESQVSSTHPGASASGGNESSPPIPNDGHFEN